jgi:aspartyl-tRNA(Asn)/glutamyl-tRNA(Gln) amidotransferase subunit B
VSKDGTPVSSWEAVIGLEVHAHLKTRTKMFCRCELEYGAQENTRTCPICLAHPGALPVPNGRAIEHTITLGLALGCAISAHAIFARKNYFYPDLPKGYQISQYEQPLCEHGALVIPTADGEERVRIVRAHLEEDAAKTVHAGGATGRSVGADYSLVDFNRGGTPLVEIVSEPDIRSADEADRYLRLLRQTIVELGVSDAEMEKGTLRADVNVSVRERGEEGYRPRWELKNMNSFTFIRRAIDAAVRQQIAAYERGQAIEQSTYDYDADTDTLTVHRSKEEADDYRYFPEPDLVPVQPPAELVERLGDTLHELPGARIRRYASEIGFERAEELVMTGKEERAAALVEHGIPLATAANVAMNEPEFLLENAAELAKVVGARDTITREAYAAAFTSAVASPISAEEYLAQTATSDESALEPAIDAVLAANPKEVETYLGGKEGVLGFLVGQVMRETQGKADPKVVNRLLREKLKA